MNLVNALSRIWQQFDEKLRSHTGRLQDGLMRNSQHVTQFINMLSNYVVMTSR